jgi:hypothetical protein
MGEHAVTTHSAGGGNEDDVEKSSCGGVALSCNAGTVVIIGDDTGELPMDGLLASMLDWLLE